MPTDFAQRERPRNGGRALFGSALTCVMVSFLVAPLVVVVLLSFDARDRLGFPPLSLSMRWYRNLFTNPDWHIPALRSLRYGIFSSLLAVLGGLAGAYGWQHVRRCRTSLLVFLISPLFVPPVVLAVGQFFVLSWFGLVDTGFGIVLCHTSITLPIAFALFVHSLTARLKLEDVACTLGAGRAYAFCRITFPSLIPTVLAALFLCFITAFDDAVISLFVTSHRAKTLPRRMFDGLRYDLDPTAAAVAGVLILMWILFVAWSWRTKITDALPIGSRR